MSSIVAALASPLAETRWLPIGPELQTTTLIRQVAASARGSVAMRSVKHAGEGATFKAVTGRSASSAAMPDARPSWTILWMRGGAS